MPQPVSDSASATDPTVFHTVLGSVAEHGIHCEIQKDSSGTNAEYFFADGSYVTWGAFSDTGEENALHLLRAHGYLDAFHAGDGPDDHKTFSTGNLETDAADLTDWLIALADQHGRSAS